MRNPALITAFIYCSLFLSFNRTMAQSDTSKSGIKSILSTIEAKGGKAIFKDKWDSTRFYIEKMEASAKNNYGEICLPHTVLFESHTANTANNKNYKSSYYYLKRGVEIGEKINDTINLAIIKKWYEPVIFDFGMTCYFIGDNTEAETYLLKAAKIYKNKRTDRYAQSNLVLAAIYATKGEYGKAQLLNIIAQEVLDKTKKGPFEYYLLASSYNNQGIIHAETGDRQKALACLKKANEINANAKGYLENEDIKMLLNLSEVYALNGYTDSALQKCKLAEDKLGSKKNSILKAEVLKEKAQIYIQQKKIQQAIVLLKQYKNITDTLSLRLDDYDATILNLAICYTKTKEFKLADSLFSKETKKLRQSGLQYSYQMQQALVGFCTNIIAEKRYDEALDSLIDLCHLTFKAMSRNFYGMSEAEKLLYKNGLDQIFNLLYECLYNKKNISKENITEICALELQRNSLVLLNEVNLQSRLRNSNDTSLSALYNKWRSNKEILSNQYSVSIDQRIFNTDSLEDICEALEKKVSAKGYVQDIANDNQTLSSLLTDIQPMCANIQFVRFHYETLNGLDSILYAAFIIKNADSTPAFVHLCSESELIKILQNKNGKWIDEDLLTQKLYNSQSKSSDDFYRLIWKPIEPYLVNIQDINYSTAGILNNIAFHALYDGNDYLLKKYVFHRFFSLSDNKNQNEVYQKPYSVSLWGNMNYDTAVYDFTSAQQDDAKTDSSFLNIPQHKKTIAQSKNISVTELNPFDTTEIAQLKKVFTDDSIEVTSYLNEYATEEVFKRQASSTTDVLHISTHGFYTQFNKGKAHELLPGSFISGIANPLFRCGLAFSGANYYLKKGIGRDEHDNGILTGYEVAQLDFRNVQLVTLSACETGLGDVTDNEGNIGLQRAFKIAGANNMLVSLWQVPAKQTAEMLSLFYNFWLNGKTMSNSLRDAESAMQKKGAPPFYWAGFVLIE